jgi:hypothetical protein
VRDINGTYSIDHHMNEMRIMHGGIPWDDRETAARIHYPRGLWPDDELDEDVVQEAACTMGIEIVDKRQLHSTSHCLLAKAFMVCVRYDAEEKPELEESPDEFREMLRDFAECGLFAELTYETTRSKL